MHRQLSLFGRAGRPAPDATFVSLRRVQLDPRSWVDHAPAWIADAETLFDEVLAVRGFAQRTRRIWEQDRREPRLTSFWSAADGPLLPPCVDELRALLTARYATPFDSVGFQLYRDGRDSVAWHRDRLDPALEEPVVALVSLGAPRRFLIRPYGGGASHRFVCGSGDLLVTGGRAQRDWEHCVPKVARAGPRLSLAFRYGAR